MPENVTGFQPTGNIKKSLIDLTYFDMLPCRSPTVFREEPSMRKSEHYREKAAKYSELVLLRHKLRRMFR